MDGDVSGSGGGPTSGITRRMPDLVDDLFDLNHPVLSLTHSRISAVNQATARRRVLVLIRNRPLDPERVLPLGNLLVGLGVKKLQDGLAALCADPTVPAINRAAPAWVLLAQDLDPRVPVERLPLLFEALVLASALVGSFEPVERVLQASFAQAAVDVEATVARIEPWRVPGVVPGHLIYGATLRSQASARAHAAIVAVLERDPLVDALVREVGDAGILAPELVSRHFDKAPSFVSASLSRCRVAEPCADCGGRDVVAVMSFEAGWTTYVRSHLLHSKAEHGHLIPLLSVRSSGPVLFQVDEDELLVDVPLGAASRTAQVAVGAGLVDQRVLWFLRRFAPTERDIEAAAVPEPLQTVQEVRRYVDALPDDLDAATQAIDQVVIALHAGVFSAERPSVPPSSELMDAWFALFDGLLDGIAKDPLKLGASPDDSYGPVWEMLHRAMGAAKSKGPLLPELEGRLNPDLRLRLARHDLLVSLTDVALYGEIDEEAMFCANEVLDAFREEARTLGLTPRTVLETVGADPEAVNVLADLLEIGPDDRVADAWPTEESD